MSPGCTSLGWCGVFLSGVGVVVLCSFFRQLMAGYINVCVCGVAWSVDLEPANGGCPN